MMDDQVVHWQNGWIYPTDFEKEFKFHLQHAKHVFVISPIMSEFYRNHFGVKSNVLFSPTDPVGALIYESPDPLGPIRICYFGAIWNWQKDALARLVENLEMLN